MVLTVAFFSKLNIEKLLIEYGTGKNSKFIAVHEVADLTTTVCSSLMFFHSFTGCDSTSAFHNKGKVTAWKTWQLLPEVTDAFNRFSSGITEIKDDGFEMIEMFVVRHYSRKLVEFYFLKKTAK